MMSTDLKHIPIFLFLMLVNLTNIDKSYADEYIAQGNFTWKLLKDGKAIVADHWNFSLEVRDKSYRINARSVDGEYYWDEETGSDGIDNYFLEQQWPSWDDKRKNSGYKEVGYVSSGAFPVKSLKPVQCIWLLSSATEYLLSPQGSFLPLNDLSYVPTNATTSKIEWSTHEPKLPVRIEGYSPAFLVKDKVMTLPKAYNNEYKVWELQVIETTNVGGLIFPRIFEYRQYIPKFPNALDKNDLQFVYKAEFQVTNFILNATLGSLLPRTIARQTEVYDFRYDKEFNTKPEVLRPALTYIITNGVWLNKDAPSIKSKVTVITQIIRTSNPFPPKSNLARILIGVLIFVPPMVFATWWCRMKQSKTSR